MIYVAQTNGENDGVLQKLFFGYVKSTIQHASDTPILRITKKNNLFALVET